jgi:hypothetical protein
MYFSWHGDPQRAAPSFSGLQRLPSEKLTLEYVGIVARNLPSTSLIKLNVRRH